MGTFFLVVFPVYRLEVNRLAWNRLLTSQTRTKFFMKLLSIAISPRSVQLKPMGGHDLGKPESQTRLDMGREKIKS